MRILFWTNFYFPFVGGLETVVYQLVSELTRQGHEASVICHSTGKDTVFDKYEGINVARFPFTTILQKGDMAAMLKVFSAIRGVVEEFKPDVINLHGLLTIPPIFQSPVISSLPPSVPVLLTMHGLLGGISCNEKSLSRLIKLATALNFVSRELAQEMLRDFKNEVPKYFVIHNGMHYPEVTHTAMIKAPLQLMIVSRLGIEKGIDVAIEAVKILADAEINFHLTIVGKGEESETLVEMVAALQLEKYITFAGAIEQNKILATMQKCSVLLVPSRYEAFGMVVLEAGCVRRPVIASRIGGLPEVVVDGVTGLLVEPENPQALADAVLYFYENPEQLEIMGKAAEQHVKREFTIEKTAKHYVAAYKELIGNKNVIERQAIFS